MRPILALLVAAALTLGGCGPGGSGAVVLVSGRDDHGLVERSHLGLRKAPDDPTITATVSDGSFARIVRSEGQWMLLRTVEATPQEGWIEDHYLRTVAVWTTPYQPIQVVFLDAESRPEGPFIHVKDRSGLGQWWVQVSELREVGAR